MSTAEPLGHGLLGRMTEGYRITEPIGRATQGGAIAGVPDRTGVSVSVIGAHRG
jgi:hypothetical protein